jgi:N6-adenosine-specific RNA methylase IME4
MKTYGAILLDPAWQFKVYSKDTGQGRSAESHYPTMSLEDMKALPVPDLMAKDCAVFMWATFPTLPEAIELGRAWGLQYKTCAFLWAKVNKRAGLWQAWRDLRESLRGAA